MSHSFSFSFTFSKAEQPRGFPAYFARHNHTQKTVRKVTVFFHVFFLFCFLVGGIRAQSFKFDVLNHFGVMKHLQLLPFPQDWISLF